MKKWTVVLMIGALMAPIVAHSQRTSRSVSFNAPEISGAPAGALFMTGGGTFDPTPGGSVHVSGAFHVLRDIGQGPLTGLKAGEGVRWEARAVLASTGFLCTGAAGERLEQAFTDDRTVVFDADFYRHSDHNQASLHARIFISTNSPAVWVQGVGCVDAQVNLH